MKFNISLFSVLLVLVCMLGYVEMVSTFISHHRPWSPDSSLRSPSSISDEIFKYYHSLFFY